MGGHLEGIAGVLGVGGSLDESGGEPNMAG